MKAFNRANGVMGPTAPCRPGSWVHSGFLRYSLSIEDVVQPQRSENI